MKVLTFDLEVENHKHNKRVASNFYEKNYIVEAGWSWNGGKRESKRWDAWHREPCMSEQFKMLEAGDIINGFNIKFDLLWVWDNPELQAALKRGVTIYCGQYVEYLLGGMTQDVQMVSMNDTAEQYGGGCKIDAVKEMWEAGHLTSEIPPDLLHDYLCGTDEIVGDVHNTWLIMKGQIEHMREHHPPEFRKMLKFRMDGLLATIEMEYNGVFVDREVGEARRIKLVDEIAAATQTLESFIPELPPELEFNWGSTTHKSCLIFGGVVKYQKWQAHTDENGNVIYAKKTEKQPLFQGQPIPESECKKSGELYYYQVTGETPGAFEYKDKFYLKQDTFAGGKRKGEGKTKNVQVDDLEKPKGAKKDHYFKFEGYTKPDKRWLSTMTDAYDGPLYSTAADIIETLGKRGLPFTTALAKRAAMLKDLGTYYYTEDAKGNKKGMLTLVGDDNLLHHKLNHTSTVTGRLSSSDPNLQNIPRADTDKSTGEAKSEVKAMFRTRFEGGAMAEIDYSQLEVVVQGVLTRDKQLMQDLNDKVDFHCKRLSAKLKEDYQHVWNMCHVEEDAEYKIGRTNAKVFSFQRAYGAGAETISESTGMPRSEVDELIAAEESLYPAVVDFDKMLEETIKRNRYVTDSKIFINGVAFTRGESFWDSPTGTRYVWREHEAPEFLHAKGKYTGFSPTERKNYPVQGFGGEIVQTMLGKVFRYLVENDRFDNKLLLVNTVHDCLWLDGDSNLINQQAPVIQKILESVPEVFNEAFPNLNVEVPFPCETEVGVDMFDMDVLHVE